MIYHGQGNEYVNLCLQNGYNTKKPKLQSCPIIIQHLAVQVTSTSVFTPCMNQ